MSHIDDRKKNFLMNENFIDVITENLKNSQHKCKHCDHKSIKSAAREQQHLKTCDAFKKEQERKQKKELTKISMQSLIIFLIRSLS
jgi:hypothetical protein